MPCVLKDVAPGRHLDEDLHPGGIRPNAEPNADIHICPWRNHIANAVIQRAEIVGRNRDLLPIPDGANTRSSWQMQARRRCRSPQSPCPTCQPQPAAVAAYPRWRGGGRMVNIERTAKILDEFEITEQLARRAGVVCRGAGGQRIEPRARGQPIGDSDTIYVACSFHSPFGMFLSDAGAVSRFTQLQ